MSTVSPIFRVFWENLKNNEKILRLLDLTVLSSDIEKREKITPFPPSDIIVLPKIVIKEVGETPNEQFPFLTNITVEVHTWTCDETLIQNDIILKDLYDLICGETFLLLPNEDFNYWSYFTWIRRDINDLFVSDLFDKYDVYYVPVSYKNMRRTRM